MKTILASVLLLGWGVIAAVALAQPPDDGPFDGPPPPMGHPVLKALDVDRDGDLSADEISKASESLKSLDKNDDGKLTEDELRPHRPPRGGDERRFEGRRFDGPRRERRGGQDGPGPRGRGPRGPGEFGPPPGGPDFGGPPPFLPPHLRDELGLSEEQEAQLEELH